MAWTYNEAGVTYNQAVLEYDGDGGGAAGQPTWKRWGGVPHVGGTRNGPTNRIWSILFLLLLL
jgi:hypothetical protein